MGTPAIELEHRLPSSYALMIAVGIGLLVSWLKDWLELDMTRHMLIEFPLLLLAGALVGHVLKGHLEGCIARCNRLGLAGFLFASLTLAYWMIPAALDAALLSGSVAAGKYVTLVLSGALLYISFRTAPLAVQVFFVGNFVWMTVTAGFIYQSAPQQLCLNYLADAQWSAGEGLVIAAVISGCAWCAFVAPDLIM